MIPWWVVAIAGVILVVGSGVGLVRRRRSFPVSQPYLRVPADDEPVDALIRSQIAASIGPTPADPTHPLTALRSWAFGTSDLDPRMDELHREVRTLQRYVLDLDTRYVSRDEAAWLTLTTTGLVVGIVSGVATTVWAVIDLAQ